VADIVKGLTEMVPGNQSGKAAASHATELASSYVADLRDELARLDRALGAKLPEGFGES
jgi:hypothetical protein